MKKLIVIQVAQNETSQAVAIMANKDGGPMEHEEVVSDIVKVAAKAVSEKLIEDLVNSLFDSEETKEEGEAE